MHHPVSDATTTSSELSSHIPDMVQPAEHMEQDQEDPMTTMANTLAQLQAQLAALQVRMAQPTNVIRMSEEQFGDFLDNVENCRQHQFTPGINPVLMARTRAQVQYTDYSPPPGTHDIKGLKTPECYSGAQLDARPFMQCLDAFYAKKPVTYCLARNRILSACDLITKPLAETWALTISDAVMNNKDNVYYTDNWGQFKDKFIALFGIPNEKAHAR
ncbi:hypothetical protein BDM02DRAFT_3193215 [Thelephora ganbajun]|uniref:Uncharacterized protein n=1 Tax=Thelephora ganbajun TaxID=370292 RepID=A0ACB6YZ34_THEGA|nr:hypothetical protein BDM02DRAFT_3193215 [Thelephora ganbajun]